MLDKKKIYIINPREKNTCESLLSKQIQCERERNSEFNNKNIFRLSAIWKICRIRRVIGGKLLKVEVKI
jgi:hypothetical protein